MLKQFKEWISKYFKVTISFNEVDIDTVDYEGGYVAVATAEDGTKITVYEKEDWFYSDPKFAYSWQKNVDGVVSTGSSRVSYYKLKNYKFKLVKVGSYEEWESDLKAKVGKAKEHCNYEEKGHVSNACIAKLIKSGAV